MARKRKSNVKPIANTNKKKKKPSNTNWKFDDGDRAIYKGGLYDEYHLKEVVIIGRLKGKIVQYYKIAFKEELNNERPKYVEVTGETLEKIEEVS